MCRLLGVTHGAYYRHLNKAVDYYHVELIEAVQELAKASDHNYGSRCMSVALTVMNYPVSHKKFKVTTDSNHAKPLFDNILNRDVVPKVSDQAYLRDITYILTQGRLAVFSDGNRLILTRCCWLEHGLKNERSAGL